MADVTLGSIERDAQEVEDLVRDYYARTIARNGMKPLNFKWQTYKTLEQAGACRLFTARFNRMLVGFTLYVVQDHFHHDDQNVAQCTMIGVRPEFRNKGIGRALVEYAEEWFKADGVTHMVHHHRVIYKVKPLFEHLGFRLEELGYVKEL